MNNHDDLHDDVDPKLQQLYRQLPKEQPSAHLDAKILAAAKITKPQPTLKKSPRWQAPFALAASVVLVSSVALYLHEENPAAFDVKTESPAQAPVTNISRSEPAPAVNNATTANNHTNTNVLADNAPQKTAPEKATDAPIIPQEKTQRATTNILNDRQLNAQAKKNAEIAHRADQIAEDNFANQSTKSAQENRFAKEQEIQRVKVENDQLAAAAPAPAPAPITVPAPQIQQQPEVTENRPLQTSRLQDLNRANQQLSISSAESDQSVILEKSNHARSSTATPMAAAPAAPINAGSLAGAAMPTAKQRDKLNHRDEATSANYAQNISAPVLSIENIAIGMGREQLVAQGMTCYIDVCRLDLSQPKQETYWGMPTENAHLTTFLSHQVVTKLVLQQRNVQLNQVKIGLSNVGIASEESCAEEKGTLLIGRQLGTNLLNVRAMGTGLSLTICQYTKSTK